MFGLSPLVGRAADRWGRRATVATGFSLFALGGLVVALFPGVPGAGGGLFLVGLGWSFAYIGGTLIVTDVTPIESRARLVGAADLGARGAAAVGSGLAGFWWAANGLPSLGWATVAIALVPLAFVLALREPRPGVYADAAAAGR
jgi:MFS family permease